VHESEYSGTGHIPGRNLETFVEYLPRPRQLGSSPDPLGGRAAPRVPPARAADNIVGEAAAVSTRRGQFFFNAKTEPMCVFPATKGLFTSSIRVV
jgi:hypothetical protein